MTADLLVPPGRAFRAIGADELRESYRDLCNLMLVYEKPRRSHRYIVSADVADGLGGDHDFSSVDVLRVGTMEEQEEQVAHFYSNTTTPTQLAYLLDAVGRYYTDDDSFEAMMAIENNNHGLSTQDMLQLHLGYAHFYRWEVFDAADPAQRYTKRIGWLTTARTRPILLDKFYEAVTSLDPISGKADLLINSPHTWAELADFQTEGALWEAAASRGAHDDAIMSLAIGHYVAYRLAGGEREPLNEVRRRKREEQQQLAVNAGQGVRPDYRNMPYTDDELRDGIEDSADLLFVGDLT